MSDPIEDMTISDSIKAVAQEIARLNKQNSKLDEDLRHYMNQLQGMAGTLAEREHEIERLRGMLDDPETVEAVARAIFDDDSDNPTPDWRLHAATCAITAIKQRMGV